MTQFELIPTLSLITNQLSLRPRKTLPELVHLNDPALSVMHDFTINKPNVIRLDETIDHALNTMKVKGVHILLVTNQNEKIVGILSSEDILGEKPITILQERRIPRQQISVEMIMVPTNHIIAFDMTHIEAARVGNIVNTLKEHSEHYALVIKADGDNEQQTVCGLFNTSQISKQLHMDVANLQHESSISELNKSHKDH